MGGQAELPNIEHGPDRARREFPTADVQNLDTNTLVIVGELQRDVRHRRIDPSIEKQVGANQVGIFR